MCVDISYDGSRRIYLFISTTFKYYIYISFVIFVTRQIEWENINIKGEKLFHLSICVNGISA